MYLYVAENAVDAEGLARVPPTLLVRFGKPLEAMRLELTPERRLARCEARTVLDGIATRGFYLQLPPVIETGQRA
jgi:uncharacterized protein YcgL (UPF0745 family)